MVHRLAQKIKSGTKFFVGHGKDNSHDGRREVGEVLASFVKEIKGKLSDIVIGHFPESSDVKEMDVCSIEADINIDDSSIVNDVNGVSAIALGASDKDSPAFPGALRLASLQCFDEEDPNPEREKKMPVTFTEVKEFIKDRNVFPHQIYTQGDIENDREFGSIYEENKKLKGDLQTSETALETERKAKTEIEAKSKVAVAKDRFDALLPKDLTDKQKTFINTRFKAEVISEMTDEDIQKYIENEKKDFADTAKLFGVTDSQQSGTETSTEATEDEGDSSPEDAALKLVGVG